MEVILVCNTIPQPGAWKQSMQSLIIVHCSRCSISAPDIRAANNNTINVNELLKKGLKHLAQAFINFLSLLTT
jgi:nicotinic acid mononucleotide adenylyltransferase